MKQLKGYRKRLMLFVIVVVFVLGSGRSNADFTFGEPTNLGPPINSSANDGSSCISADGLSLYFVSNRSGGFGGEDIWVTTRETTDDDWSIPVNLGPPVNSPANEIYPSISANGLELYFFSTRPGGSGGADLWVTTRETTDEDWGTPVNLGPRINSSANEYDPSISTDGLSLYFASDRPGGLGAEDIWVITRTLISGPWGEPVNLGPVVNSSVLDVHPSISADGLALFFTSARLGGYGSWDLYVTKRLTVSDPWGTPVNLGPTVNTAYGESSPGISPNGLTLHFGDYPLPRPGGYGNLDIWQAPIIPIVDLNSDGTVDAVDMCIMVDHWGTDNSLCDIGPMPWGDGIVDGEDLKVLAEHLFEEVNDPTLVAHWPLDEAEGMVVADGAGGNDGFALGDPVWLHDGGQVNGALHLDGVDDYVVTGAAPNPEGNSYSVLAWMKGGAPGQVVLSQMGKANWLSTDPSEGTLMTELTASGRNGRSLGSEAVITDGNWHRIAFVWDGSYRRLYVDGVIVAEDAQDSLDISVNSLYFGTGKTMEPSSFWSGLIDDIRIYNRAVHP